MLKVFTRKKEATESIAELDENRVALLSLFIKPHSLDYYPRQDEVWKSLGSSYKKIIENLEKTDLLREANVKERLSIILRVSDLKASLKEHDLKVSGRKADLLSRFVDNLPAEAQARASTISSVYICTEKGKEIAEGFLDEIELKRKNIEDQVIQFLRKDEFKMAANMIDEFYLQLPLPIKPDPPGLGLTIKEDVPVYAYFSEAKSLVDVEAPSGISQSEFEETKIKVINHMLWDGTISAPEKYLPIFYRHFFRSSKLNRLKTYEEAGIKKVEILCNPGACFKCKEFSGKKFLLNDALKNPPIPIEECTHELGWCRCDYLPVIAD